MHTPLLSHLTQEEKHSKAKGNVERGGYGREGAEESNKKSINDTPQPAVSGSTHVGGSAKLRPDIATLNSTQTRGFLSISIDGVAQKFPCVIPTPILSLPFPSFSELACSLYGYPTVIRKPHIPFIIHSP